MSNAKKILRNEMLEQLGLMTAQERSDASREIC